MKKIMMSVIVAAVVCIACQSFSDTVNWYAAEELFNPGGSSTPFDVGYNPYGGYSGQWDESWGNMADYGYEAIPQTSDWAVRILTVMGGYEVASTSISGTHWSDAGMDGFFFQGFDYQSSGNAFNGQEIFTRFYNNADWTLASGYADAGFTTINWPSATAPNPPNEYFYNIGKVAISIPEPSTALLLGTGGLVVWAGRRKLNREAGTKVAPKKMQKVNLLHR